MMMMTLMMTMSMMTMMMIMMMMMSMMMMTMMMMMIVLFCFCFVAVSCPRSQWAGRAPAGAHTRVTQAMVWRVATRGARAMRQAVAAQRPVANCVHCGELRNVAWVDGLERRQVWRTRRLRSAASALEGALECACFTVVNQQH